MCPLPIGTPLWNPPPPWPPTALAYTATDRTIAQPSTAANAVSFDMRFNMDVVIAPPLFSVGEFGAKTKMISVGDARMALPSGRNVRSGKHLKNKRKLAWLLRHCYHEVLPPINQPRDRPRRFLSAVGGAVSGSSLR